MSLIHHYLDQAAERWGIAPNAARWLFWAPVIISVLLPFLRLNGRIYHAVLREDGPVEMATAILFFVAFLAAGRAALSLLRNGYRVYGAIYVAFAFVMFFCAGEEISWGQRILGFSTPAPLEEINDQNELTLHNIEGALDTLKVVMMIGGAVGASAYLINEKVRIQRWWTHADHLLVPPFFVASAFFLMFAYRLFRYIFVPDFHTTITRYGEWIEFCFAYGFVVFAVLVYRYVTVAQQIAVETSVVA
jgi:hypothetical protein